MYFFFFLKKNKSFQIIPKHQVLVFCLLFLPGEPMTRFDVVDIIASVPFIFGEA